MNNIEFGFSLTGLVVYALQLLPNLVWIIKPPVNNVLTKNSSPHRLLNTCEQVFGILTVVGLILLIYKGNTTSNNSYLGLAILFLVGYYIAWIFYYRGVVSPWLLITGIAAMPPLYFFFAALWMNKFIVLVPCLIFGIVHIFITCATYLKTS